MSQPEINTSPKVADEVRTTTCYMCACRCGIRVHLRDGTVRYIDGNPDHPVNRGVICGKGASGIMQHYSPARLTAPLLRTGPRGSGEFKEISWDEALTLATEWMGEVRARDPKRLAFFTGRDQSQALTGWWAIQYGTPNYAAHGGFCSVNMAAAGLYTFGGSFWEFGEPDWEHTQYFLMFGVAEDHASNPLKTHLGNLKKRGGKFVSINPVRTGYSAIADEWLGITPGTDGLLVAALIHELLARQKIDLDYLVRYTNAPWLVIRDPGAADDGLFARDGDGRPLAWDKAAGGLCDATASGTSPALTGSYTLPDGRTAVPSFVLLAERFLQPEYAPDNVASRTGISADTIRRIAGEIAETAFEKEVTLDIPWTDWTGKQHDKVTGRPVSMHAMRGISAHSNGFHTCRMLHVLQILIGSIDCPGGFRYKPPYPKDVPPALKPNGRLDTLAPNSPLAGGQLGFPMGPEDLLVDDDGNPARIDKAYSWEAPFAAHGMMHMVIANAARRDPYPVDVLFMYMANMGWNSSMNVPDTIAYLAEKESATGDYKIGKIIYSDAYYSETVPYADLILPDTTYLERWDCISLLDRPISDPDRVCDSIRQPVVTPDRDVRPFQDVLIELGARLSLPGFTNDAGEARYPGGYSDYMVNHERAPGIGSLAGWRGEDGKDFGKGAPNKDQLRRYIDNGCFHAHELAPEQRYFKHANRDYLQFAKEAGFRGSTEPLVFQLYLEPLQKFRLAARGKGTKPAPDVHRNRMEAYFDPLPFWYEPFGKAEEDDAFPLHAITQRPMHMYHAWGSQNAWLRQITAENRLYINREKAGTLGLADDDWVYLSSPTGRITCQVRLMDGVNPDTVWTWNAIGKRSGAWGLSPDAPESQRGFLLNHLITELLPENGNGYRYSNSDPVTGQAAWYDLKVKIEKAPAHMARSLPKFETLPRPPGAPERVESLQFGKKFRETAQ